MYMYICISDLYENYPGAKPEEEENAYENTAFSKAPEK